MKKNYISIVLVLFFYTTIDAQKNIYWRGGADGADNGNWFGDNGCSEIGQAQSNWYYPDFTNNEARDQPNCNDGSTDRHFLNFDNDHQVSMNVNSALSICRLLFQNTTLNTSRVISGSDITIANTNSNTPKIENYSSAVHTINSNIIVNFSGGEINPVNGSLSLAGNINNNSNNIQVYGNNGHTLTIGGVLSGSGNLIIEQNSIVVIDSDATMSGSTTLNAGTLQLNASMSSSAITVNSGATLKISDDATISSLTVNEGGTVIIDTGKGLNITGNLSNSGTFTINSDDSANTSGSLRVTGSASGNITFNVNVDDTDWHLVSAPVENEQYDNTWVTTNSLSSGTTNTDHRGLGWYDNTTDADGDWSYYTVSSTPDTNFNSGQGYAIQRTTSGNIAFTGNMRTTDGTRNITVGNSGTNTENKWNLVGNPFPSFVSISDLITNNTSDLGASYQAVYVWNGTAYTPLTTGHISPGQGFFVSAADNSSRSIDIAEGILSHQSSATFYRTDPNTQVVLLLSDGSSTKTTEINYLEGKTTGLDPRFDLGTFTGQSSSFNIYTQLVSDSEGINFMIQSLPNKDHESIVVPLGVSAEIGKEITFTAEATNLPAGLKVFLEDRENNVVTRLDEANANYSVTLNEALNGVGRFYLHTTSEALSTENIALEGVNVFSSDKNILRVTGINSTNASIKIFNVLGKKVLDTSFSSKGATDINLPNLNTGVYIVQLVSEKGKLNKKIVLN